MSTVEQTSRFGELLRHYRSVQGLSQEELAERAGLSVQAISALERGVTQWPYSHTVNLLAQALGVAPAERQAMETAARRPGKRSSATSVSAPTAMAIPATLATPDAEHSQAVSLPNSLLLPPTPLLGRDDEFAMIERLLRGDPQLQQGGRSATRLITLTGPGGVGKTRLALALATAAQGAFPDGVFIVPLAPVRDSSLVLATLAGVLRVTENSSRPLLDSLSEALHGRRVLLVLDNFEHVVDAAPTLSTLLTACPQLTVLTTSRAALRLRGEQEIVIAPLPVPDLRHLPSVPRMADIAAVALFISRAQEVRAGFALTADTARTVAEICVRLDGLPLAIELAASWLRLLTPTTLLDRLDRRLTLLTGGPRDLPRRQQTLRATIDWSYELLTPDDQHLFRQLSVFHGGATLEALEAVVAGSTPDDDIVEGTLNTQKAAYQPTTYGHDVLSELNGLREKSLLQVEEKATYTWGPWADTPGAARYSMLETIREYARERLRESDEEPTVRRAHALYYVDLAEKAKKELTGPQQMTWLAWIDREYANLRAALYWTCEDEVSRSDTTIPDGPSGSESQDRISDEAAADRPQNMPASPTPAEIGLRLVAALWRWWARGNISEGRTWCERILARAGTARSDNAFLDLRARALNSAGILVTYQGDTEGAMTFYQQTLEIWRALGYAEGVASVLNNLGIIAYNANDNGQAALYFEECLAISRTLNDPWGLAGTLSNCGLVAYRQGKDTQAATFHHESLEIRRQLGDTWGIVVSLSNLGSLAFHQGDISSAVRLYLESLVLVRQLGDAVSAISSLLGLAQIARTQGALSRAARLVGAVEALLAATGLAAEAVSDGDSRAEVSALQALLPADLLATEMEMGRHMTLEQAITYASVID